ncbi:hypothetical protein EVAR_24432_1 [Eumeta japonica]|uniref:Uncharacterized protein n=1 Tax=Eumeta variegata TaxID=151549 RepID=A0A4C1VS46_EUMVA|nr:hypothetical protein EVAR_24432_1 [Eumeta japonica]
MQFIVFIQILYEEADKQNNNVYTKIYSRNSFVVSEIRGAETQGHAVGRQPEVSVRLRCDSLPHGHGFLNSASRRPGASRRCPRGVACRCDRVSHRAIAYRTRRGEGRAACTLGGVNDRPSAPPPPQPYPDETPCRFNDLRDHPCG